MQAEIAQSRLVAPELQRPAGVVHLHRKKFNAATQSFLDLLLQPEGA